jgi:hypothetical protein
MSFIGVQDIIADGRLNQEEKIKQHKKPTNLIPNLTVTAGK